MLTYSAALQDENYLVSFSHLIAQSQQCAGCGQGPVDLFSQPKNIKVRQQGLGAVFAVPCRFCRYQNKVSCCAFHLLSFLNADLRFVGRIDAESRIVQTATRSCSVPAKCAIGARQHRCRDFIFQS